MVAGIVPSDRTVLGCPVGSRLAWVDISELEKI